MKIKKVTAALLCAAMTVSFCSCNSNKKATTDIEAVIKEFESALQEADTDALLELTSWDDDDKDYKNIEELIDDAEYTIELAEHKEYIASTIKVNYEKEDIEINGRVEGNISSGNTITVTEGGSIKGDIAAENYILDGVSEGNAKVQKFCKIGKAGSFTGELFASTLVTEDGSEFEGTLHLKKAKAPVFVQPEEPAPEEAPAEEPAF